MASNCAGDPGKVSDSQYWCSTDDGGGVHTNSGVPNHAFALAVDGGSFNGRTVQGIGLTKAAHIWWRAMSVYQTRVSEFIDHADLVELSCNDLIGASLFDLATGNVSGEVITSTDCDQVAEAMLATEMRELPTQCNFPLVLQPDAPELSRYPDEVFYESFDTDPGPDWVVSSEGVDLEDYVPRDWVWTTDVPSGGEGGSLFATDDDRVELLLQRSVRASCTWTAHRSPPRRKASRCWSSTTTWPASPGATAATCGSASTTGHIS